MPRKNARKNKTGRNSEGRGKGVAKRILRPVAAGVLILAIFLFFKNSRYFELSGIEVTERAGALGIRAAELLKVYKGRNIFGIDIKSLSAQIKADFPVIKEAVVKRVLPNKLEISVVPRIPVAKIKARGYFPVDRAGMILPPAAKTGRLPVITGFSIWVRPRVGEKLRNRQLEKAFLLIDALEETSILSAYNVTTIDVSNYENLSFYFENGIEIKIGGGGFPSRLKKLKMLLADENLDMKNIKYIDLRFKDVVVGPK